MADNFLEKRYDEVFGNGGSRSVGPTRPSLDVLIRKGAEVKDFDPAYKVHIFQLQAIINTVRASHAADGFTFEPDAERATITVSGAEDRDSLVRLGECMMLMKLKATELGLSGIQKNIFTLSVGKPAL